MTAFFNGEFIDEQHARLHISDLSIQRGYGVFDFFRVINRVPIFMEDHLDRFFNSAAGLGLHVNLEREQVKPVVHELIERNGIDGVSGIKITLTGGYSPGGYEVLTPNFFVTQQVLQPRPAQALKVITYEHMRELPNIKSINYITGLMLQKKLAEAGVADVLYHRNNEVSEFPRSTFFIVTKDDVVATPGKNVLPGITRKKILELASNAEERTITLDDIRNAKEAFIASTTKQILPIVQVDDIIIGNGKPGETTAKLEAQLQDLIASCLDK